MKKPLLIFLIFIFLLPFSCREIKIKVPNLICINSLEFSLDNLKFVLSLQTISEHKKEILLKQAILETGNFTSTVFKENNNLFGMKHPYIRKTTSLGTNRNHAVYENWVESVKDYIYWLDFHKERSRDMIDYYKFLVQVNYATDENYIKKLKQIKIN